MNIFHQASVGWCITLMVLCNACSAQRPVLLEKLNVVRLPAVADVGLSDAIPSERNTNSGKCSRLKLKNIQEMVLIRFDANAVVGREVKKASLFFRRSGSDELRYVRISTVNADWVEGKSTAAYGPPTGATFLYADGTPGSERSWAWPGSSLADVIMTAGNSLASWSERRELEGGWVSVPISADLVYALAVGDTDGLAIMDGGNPANHNNFIFSSELGTSGPFLEVEMGNPLDAIPLAPVVSATPAPTQAHLESGAVRIEIGPDERTFCWRLKLDDRPLERWHVKHPERNGPTVFHLEDLEPDRAYRLEVVAVSKGGHTSTPTLLNVTSSPALSRNVSLGPFEPTSPRKVETPQNDSIRVWPLPGLVKIDPKSSTVLSGDLGPTLDGVPTSQQTNPVWDGERIRLFGAQGECVSYQLCIENVSGKSLRAIRVLFKPMTGPNDATLGPNPIESYKNWYAKNRKGQWQPSYCVPLRTSDAIAIPDPMRMMTDQKNQTVYVDLHIPKNTPAEKYLGAVGVDVPGETRLVIPIELEVLDFSLPDRLSFWPELNAYSIPKNAYEYYRLAHQHRCVFNCMFWKPQLQGSGKEIRVHWQKYDEQVGPLLTGAAFRQSRRPGVPIECMYLPFGDSWPTPLSTKTYHYTGRWKGTDLPLIQEHYMTAPYIAHGLSRDYQEAFLAVERQFIEHFREKGYSQTEMQCFFGGKATHRIEYGANMWWTTDEPYHWDDWLALQFFCHLWTAGRGSADPRIWSARADISRPQWQGRVLRGAVDTVYFGAGGFNKRPMVRRCRILGQESPLGIRSYGSASPDNSSNTENVTAILSTWCDGANAFLPWQTLGSDTALDQCDAGLYGGAAMLVPGTRFKKPVLGDLRLKAYRDAQQLIEYLTILSTRRSLTREQIKAMLHEVVGLDAKTRQGTSLDSADSMQFGSISAWQLSELRHRIAMKIIE